MKKTETEFELSMKRNARVLRILNSGMREAVLSRGIRSSIASLHTLFVLTLAGVVGALAIIGGAVTMEAIQKVYFGHEPAHHAAPKLRDA